MQTTTPFARNVSSARNVNNFSARINAHTALRLAKRDSSGPEQYYTRPQIARHCVTTAQPYFNGAPIIEPSAGTGEFVKVLQGFGLPCLAYDIEPKHPQVARQNFLMLERDAPAFVIGNPPFGRNHALSVRFFNHAANFADYIAFIVPKSWRKWSVQNRLAPRFHLVEDIDLPKDIFYNARGEGLGANFNAVFQVWEKRAQNRVRVVVEDRGYVQRCSPQEATVALTYGGYSSGRVETEFERKPNTTKIYLKASARVIHALRQLDYSKINCNAAYTPVFGLQEVLALLNRHFDNENFVGERLA